MTLIQNILLNTLSAAFTVYSFFLFYDIIARRKTKNSITLLCFVLITVLFTLTLTFAENRLINLLVLSTLTISASWIFDMKWYNHLIMPLLIIAIPTVAEIIVAGTMSILFSIDLEKGRTGVYYVMGLLLSKFLVYIFIIIFKFSKHKLLFGRFKKSTFFIILVPLSTVAVMLLQYNYYILIPQSNSSFVLAALLCYSLLILSNILMFDVIDNVYNSTMKDTQIEMASEIIKKQEEQYRQFLMHQKDLLKIRHDQKNYILGLIDALENKKYENALSSLRNEYSVITNSVISQNSQNGILHLIVSNKTDEARRMGIEIDYSYRNIDRINISPIDLAIALGNALDNAIEATDKVTDKEKIIRLYVATQNNSVIINIKNPTEHNVDIDDLGTTKTDPSLHGFGIIGIKSIVAKYHGNVAFKCENKEFQTTMIIDNDE